MKKKFHWIWYAIWLLICLVGGGGTLFSWMPRTPAMFYGGCAMLAVSAIVGVALLLLARGKGAKKAWTSAVVAGAVYIVLMAAIVLVFDYVLFDVTNPEYQPVHSSITVVVLNFWLIVALCVAIPKRYDPKLTVVKRGIALVLCCVALALSGLPQNFWWGSQRSNVAIGNWKPTGHDFGDHVLQDKKAFDEGAFIWGETDLMVSPDGDDQNPGTQELPLATLQAAKEKAVEGSTVWFRAGTYLLNEVITFNAQDAKNVTYRSMPGEEVVFTGAVSISDWENGTINGISALVADVDTENWYFHSLFMDGQRLQESVWPKEGSFYVKDIRDEDKLADSYEWGAHGAFYVDTDEIMEFSNLEDVYVRMSHWWLDQLMPLSSVDAHTGRIEVSRASSRSIEKGDPFIYVNVREALSEPGEWYLDRSEGKLYYIPRENQTAANTVVYAPVTDAFLVLDGASGIRLQGIRFENTDWDFYAGEGPGLNPEHPLYQNMKYGCGPYQANNGCPEVFSVRNSTDIHFVDCEMVNISYNCIQFGINTRDCTVEACRFENIGGSAIAIKGKNEIPSTTGNIAVTDCEVAGFGQVFNQAVGIHLTYGDHCTISGNEIHDGNYTGISAGWTWGYDAQATAYTTITNNLVYNIGVDGLLSDLGGIYLLGPQPGSILRGNVIYNIDCYDYGYGATGIYLDAGSSGWLIENNLVSDCATQCFTTAHGKDNIVRNNIFAYGNRRGFYVGVASDVSDECSLEFYNNIVLVDDAPIMEETIPMDWFAEKNNVLFDTSRNTVYCGLSTMFWERTGLKGMIKNGHFEEDLVTDPLFRDPQNRDFTLNEDSPAFTSGFVVWETKAGSKYDFNG